MAARPMSPYYEAPYHERWAEEPGLLDWYEPEFADSVPHFAGLAVDAERRLWVQLEQGGYRPDPVWDVFDPDGIWLGAVRMPVDFRIHDSRSNEVAGVRRDELRVEYVQIRRLSIPGGG